MCENSSNVKDWLINKCKDASMLLQGDHAHPVCSRRYGNVVLTPSNIPQFQIPASLDVRSRDDSDTYSQSSDSSLPCSGHTSPRLSPASREPTPNLLTKPPSPHGWKSAPVSPVRVSNASRLERFNTLAGEKVDIATNADPYSVAAMSLPHLKTMTNFGFETLRESPNTRRKESLFHDAPSVSRSSINRKCQSYDGSAFEFSDEVKMDRRHSYKRRNVPSVVAPLGVLLPLSCNEASPNSYSKSPSPRDSVSPRSDKLRFKFSPKKEKRRTPSPTSPQQAREKVNMWLINGRRQSCGPRLLIEDTDLEPPKTSAPKHNVLCKSLSMNSEFVNRCEESDSSSDADYGSVELCLEYTASAKQLKVTLVKCLELNKKKPDMQLNPYATVCLMPGKLQRSISSVIRNCNDPSFMETFLFKDLSEEQLQEGKLRIRLYHKSQSLRRKDFLGEIMMYLQDFDLSQQVHIHRKLENKERDNVGIISHFSFRFPSTYY